MAVVSSTVSLSAALVADQIAHSAGSQQHAPVPPSRESLPGALPAVAESTSKGKLMASRLHQEIQVTRHDVARSAEERQFLAALRGYQGTAANFSTTTAQRQAAFKHLLLATRQYRQSLPAEPGPQRTDDQARSPAAGAGAAAVIGPSTQAPSSVEDDMRTRIHRYVAAGTDTRHTRLHSLFDAVEAFAAQRPPETAPSRRASVASTLPAASGPPTVFEPLARMELVEALLPVTNAGYDLLPPGGPSKQERIQHLQAQLNALPPQWRVEREFALQQLAQCYGQLAPHERTAVLELATDLVVGDSAMAPTMARQAYDADRHEDVVKHSVRIAALTTMLAHADDSDQARALLTIAFGSWANLAHHTPAEDNARLMDALLTAAQKCHLDAARESLPIDMIMVASDFLANNTLSPGIEASLTVKLLDLMAGHAAAWQQHGYPGYDMMDEKLERMFDAIDRQWMPVDPGQFRHPSAAFKASQLPLGVILAKLQQHRPQLSGMHVVMNRVRPDGAVETTAGVPFVERFTQGMKILAKPALLAQQAQQAEAIAGRIGGRVAQQQPGERTTAVLDAHYQAQRGRDVQILAQAMQKDAGPFEAQRQKVEQFEQLLSKAMVAVDFGDTDAEATARTESQSAQAMAALLAYPEIKSKMDIYGPLMISQATPKQQLAMVLSLHPELRSIERDKLTRLRDATLEASGVEPLPGYSLAARP
ncbi:hypothetical protein [Herbaspirillum sp. YR522]|uniref:hypothetical protein n=1 Tax=Herbaspirillum sp. YR522 TaxID=1144342 RepID=UPI00026F88DC|nr:hypothetical protein [Herbaspirillum sp. YR522]EJM96291.1 hypothetical protein PMI40_04690 [Herbaspirillum sp. YR522]